MKTNILYFLSLFLLNVSYAQVANFEVNYLIVQDRVGYTVEVPSLLQFQSNTCFYTIQNSKVGESIEDMEKRIKDMEEGKCEDCGTGKMKPLILKGADDYIFKDFSSPYYIFNWKKFTVKDTVQMSWNLSSETDTILGYKCFTAKTIFRGRSYTAYYAPDIKVNIGPWKFNGLPGLILKVITSNNDFTYEATKINFNIPVEDLYARNRQVFEVNKDFINWNEYVKLANKNYFNRVKAAVSSTESENVSITTNKPNTQECIYLNSEEEYKKTYKEKP